VEDSAEPFRPSLPKVKYRDVGCSQQNYAWAGNADYSGWLTTAKHRTANYLAAARRKSLGERVRQLRRDAGISQEDFADACGFARSYMSRIERGTSNLSLDRLAVALGISIEELFKGL
jgi:DNA-binding XRE family transcriptional regulator